MKDAWAIAGYNFKEDDGSLPGIEFSSLTPTSVCTLFEYFRTHGRIVSESATLYVKSRLADVPIADVDDPSGMVVDGTAYPFIVCFGGISFGGVPLPEIGVFVFDDCIELDYRMGSIWNRQNVDAFFRLLVHLKRLVPESVIQSAANEGLPYPVEFNTALAQYSASIDQ